MSKEAMNLALEALEWVVEQGGGPNCEHEASVCFCKENKAITALQKALAEQPAQSQSPVAWVEGEEIYWHNAPDLNDWIRQNGQPLYTSPPASKPLTNGQTKLLWHKARMCMGSNRWTVFKNLIEAAHNIKGQP